jgi:hypothetical protein
MAAHAEGLRATPNFKFVVSMAAVEDGWKNQLGDLFLAPLKTPSIHIVGQKDEYLDGLKRAIPVYDSPRVIWHAEGHRPFPAAKPAALLIVDQILNFVDVNM